MVFPGACYDIDRHHEFLSNYPGGDYIIKDGFQREYEVGGAGN